MINFWLDLQAIKLDFPLGSQVELIPGPHGKYGMVVGYRWKEMTTLVDVKFPHLSDIFYFAPDELRIC